MTSFLKSRVRDSDIITEDIYEEKESSEIS
jgi:hypothetical protein